MEFRAEYEEGLRLEKEKEEAEVARFAAELAAEEKRRNPGD